MPTVSETVLAQLGGNKFLVMTGARDLTTSGNDLTFKLPRNASRCNWVRITLDAADTYTVQFGRARGLSLVIDKTRELVHADQLREVFTAHTGLDTSL
jgi:hypothetical protein